MLNIRSIKLVLVAVVAASCAAANGNALATGASPGVPVGSPVYEDIERLEVKGLVSSAMLSARPFSRFEAARLVAEAKRSPRLMGGGQSAHIIRRLSSRLSPGPGRPATYLKPLDSAYLKSVYSSGAPYFANVNNRGDSFPEGGALRAGFEGHAVFFDSISVYLNPEYRLDEGAEHARLVRGNAALHLAGLELMAGRETLRWGPGAHGGLILTDNAEPLDMIRLTTGRPVVLPQPICFLGLFRPTVFVARLERERAVPRAKLLGMRLDFKPRPWLSIGLSRVFMFGGEGRRGMTLADWGRVFIAADSAEHADSPVNGNQIVSVDAAAVFTPGSGKVPFNGIKLYTEWGAEDSSGDTKTPTGRANIYGAYVDEPLWLRGLDFRIEWANTARSARYGPTWYTHGVYLSGYTHKGRVMGHHMGTDARDLFLRAQYHAEPGLKLGLEADFERSGVHSAVGETRRKWLGGDVTVRRRGIGFIAGVGLEWQEAPGSPLSDNAVVWARIEARL